MTSRCLSVDYLDPPLWIPIGPPPIPNKTAAAAVSSNDHEDLSETPSKMNKLRAKLQILQQIAEIGAHSLHRLTADDAADRLTIVLNFQVHLNESNDFDLVDPFMPQQQQRNCNSFVVPLTLQADFGRSDGTFAGFRVLESDCAVPFVPSSGAGDGVQQQSFSLRQLTEQFEQHLANLQEFYAETTAVHRELPVLRPSAADRRSLSYQLAVTEHILLDLTIDPWRPRALPVLLLTGKESADRQTLIAYRRRFNGNAANWDESAGLVANLRRCFASSTEEGDAGELLPAFELSFTDSQKERANEPCLICRCDETSADFTCGQCQKMFHAACLYQWLIRRRAKLIMGHASGACPHCKATVKVKHTRK